MTDTTQDPRLSIGGNNPPSDVETLKINLAENNKELLKRAADLIEAADRMPTQIDDDNQKADVTTFLGQIVKCDKALEGVRVTEKEPYLSLGRVVDGFFKSQQDALNRVRLKVKPLLDARLNWEREEERKRMAREAAERKAIADAQMAAAAELEQAKMLIAADAAMTQAVQSEAQANRLEAKSEGKISVMSRTTDGASASLRTTIKAEETDRNTLDLELLRHHLTKEAIQSALNSLVKTGQRECAGARIWEHSESVVRG